MLTDKKEVYRAILGEYDKSFTGDALACDKGCAACCTQGVTITELEAEVIRDFVVSAGLDSWMVERLGTINVPAVKITTNELAMSCINGQEVDTTADHSDNPCPFLVDNCCWIYEARPFMCRCFGSTIKCHPGQEAALPEIQIYASTVVMQIIEHLGQGGEWGNMLDMLRLEDERKGKVLVAKPSPGFLFQDQDNTISKLLKNIFNKEIGDKKIEDILNGK